jgi:ketosteroid isomerase-like protein
MTPHLSRGDDRAAAIVGHVTASPAGKILDAQNVLILRCEDGQISRRWTIPGDQYAYDEFWE